MNKSLNLLLTILLFSSTLTAQTLSRNAEVSLLTIDPGEELFSFAGHTAVRIRDPQLGIDANFNYGVFDFRTEGFYIKFLRGTLPYQLGAYNYRQETPLWLEEGRMITEQVLNLDSLQKQQVFDFLTNNYKPENREYAYKFFYDNCSTRVRDILELVAGDSLTFSQTLNADSTFRDWLDVYNRRSKNDWTEFGMNIVLGLPSDEKTNASRSMYIPDNLMYAFDSAKVFHDGQWQPLVKSKATIGATTIDRWSYLVKPFILFSLLFLVVCLVSFKEYTASKWYLWLDKLLFTLTGIMGWFMLGLWFLTDHGVMNENLNLLWAFPLVLPAVWLLNRKKETKKWLKNLFGLQTIFALIILVGFNLLPQAFHVAVLPIAVTVLLRSFLIWRRG